MPVQPVRTDAARPAPPGATHRRLELTARKVARAHAPKQPPSPPRHVPKLIPLPDVRQATGYTCGTASLLSLLAYYGWKGDDPDEKDFAKELGTTWKDGTEPDEIARMSNKLGVGARVVEGMTLDDLADECRRGHPVMVAYQAYPETPSVWADDWRDGHWSIVIGVDDKNVYLEDPSMLGKRGFIPRDEFLARWHDTDRQNRPVYEQLGIVFSSNTPARDLNPVTVKKLAYVP